MAFEHYIAVRNSDLYEYKGFAKSILMTIAHLIISEPKENEQGKLIGERDPEAGWCVAGEDYIASAVGCSPDTVSKSVVQMGKDGWLEIETRRNKFGHPYNKYRIPADKLKEIKARAYKKDESGKIIRGVQAKKARKLARGDKGKFLTARCREVSAYGDPSHALGTGESRVPSRLGAEELNGSVPSSLTAPCADPHGSVPSSVGFRELSERVQSASAEKNAHHTGADKPKTNTKSNILSSREFSQAIGAVEIPAPIQGTLSPEPPAEASRLETPGIDLSPVGDAPVSPPPAPKLPQAHFTHKWRSLGSGHIHCEFCGCGRNSQFSKLTCRPDPWANKDECNIWALSQAVIVITAMNCGIPDIAKVVVI